MTLLSSPSVLEYNLLIQESTCNLPGDVSLGNYTSCMNYLRYTIPTARTMSTASCEVRLRLPMRQVHYELSQTQIT
jgi:hypothetical protein